MNKRKLIITTIIVLAITIICCYFVKPLINKINFGLDLQGGFEVLYEVKPLKEDGSFSFFIRYSFSVFR